MMVPLRFEEKTIQLIEGELFFQRGRFVRRVVQCIHEKFSYAAIFLVGL